MTNEDAVKQNERMAMAWDVIGNIRSNGGVAFLSTELEVWRDLGRQEGSGAFCHFLRGRVDPTVLLTAWEEFKGAEKDALTNPQTYEDLQKPIME